MGAAHSLCRVAPQRGLVSGALPVRALANEFLELLSAHCYFYKTKIYDKSL